MIQEVEFLNHLLKPHDTIILACSGGPDSMCLFDLLVKLKAKKELNIIVAHINHNKRKESKEEYQFVKKMCKENEVIFEGTEFQDYDSKVNFHKNAHQKRKEFYDLLRKKYNANYIMTAHHGDDLIETILMRIARGSDLKGYKGFQRIKNENGYAIVKPLITTTKKLIEKYNEENKIKYVIDKSNYSSIYTRNRYRMNVLPFLKDENPDIHQKYLKFSENMCRIDEFIVKNTKNALTDCLNDDTLLIVKLKSYDSFIIREVIKVYLFEIYQNDIDRINDKHIEMILELINSKNTSDQRILPKNWIIRKFNNRIWLEKDSKQNDFCIKLNDHITIDQHRIEKIEKSSEKNNFILRLNSKEIAFPVFVRNPKKSDKIEVKNAKGHQKLNRIFIDKKIPPQKRIGWPILVDNKGEIVWIPGLKKSKFDKEKEEYYDIIYKYSYSKENNYVKKK